MSQMPPTPTARATTMTMSLATKRSPLPARRSAASSRVADEVVEPGRDVGGGLLVGQEDEAEDDGGEAQRRPRVAAASRASR